MDSYAFVSPGDSWACDEASSLAEVLLGDDRWRSPEPLDGLDLLVSEATMAGKDPFLAGAQCKSEAGVCCEPSDHTVPCKPGALPAQVKVKEEHGFELNVFDLDSALFGGAEFGLDLGEDLFVQPASLDGVVPTMEPANSSGSSGDLMAGSMRDALSSSSELATFAYRPTAVRTSVFMPTAPEAVPACASSPGTAVAQRQATVARGDAWGAGGDALASADAPLDRHARVMRYREKRKRRTFEKTIRYQSRKAYAEVRPRIKGRFATKEEVAAMKAAAAAGLPAPVFA